jgi:hypothetical protein
MSYDEEQQKRSRVVIETPTARREVVQQQTVRYPAPPERRGYSTGVLATVALLAIAATAIIFLFLTNSRDDASETNVNIRAGAVPQATPYATQPAVVQTPMTMPSQPPVIIQQVPAPVTTTAPPIVVQGPPVTGATTTAPPATAPPAAASGSDDTTLQTKVDAAFAGDTAVAAANVDALVVNGRVKLTGTVSSEAVKQRAERLAYAVKGVLGVDNKIEVAPATP